MGSNEESKSQSPSPRKLEAMLYELLAALLLFDDAAKLGVDYSCFAREWKNEASTGSAAISE